MGNYFEQLNTALTMRTIKILFVIIMATATQVVFGQSAIGQLENITGQKINRYNGGSSNYDMNSMINGMIAQGLVSAIFNSNSNKYPTVREVKTQQVFLNTTIVGEKERVDAALRIDKYNRVMKAYRFMKDTGLKYVAFKDQKRNELYRMDSAWLVFQKKMIKERLEHENYWCKNIYNSLQKMDSAKTLADYMPYKKASQLEPGDVILVGPTADYFSQKQANLDAWANNNNAYVTHTLTCVKVVDGKKIFLDNQATEGARMISEEELNKRYGDRDVSIAQLRQTSWGVAQPLNKEEADQLWNKAREMAQSNKDNANGLFTNYGLYGNDNMVCSESSWQLMNATGRYKIPFSTNIPLVTGVQFSPASFYNNQQYFLITPLKMGE